MSNVMLNRKWRILLLDTKEGNPNHYILLAIEDALINHPSVELVRSPGYSDALNTAIHEKCNLFIAFDGEQMDRGLCQRLSVVCGNSLLWVTDDPYDNASSVRNSSIFDFVFTNDSGSVASYPGKAGHLPFAAYPKFHYHEIPDRDEGHYLYDLLFIGTAWPNRVTLFKKLLSGLKGLKIKLALPYNQYIPVPELDIPESAYLWRTPNTESARMANRSRIVLTLHRDYAGAGNKSMAATPGPRLFETALSGGFQLVDLSLPEVSGYFKVGQEIAGFKTSEDCLDQIRYYMDRPEKRLEMARAAQQRCISDHLYEHRVEQLFEIMSARKIVEQENKTVRTSTHVKKTRILHVVHNYVGVTTFGGVEVYVDMLVRNLPSEYESLVYYPDRNADPSGREVLLRNIKTNEEIRHTFEHPYNPSSLLDGERDDWFVRMLHEHRIDLVHFHHIINHPWSLPLAARTMGLPVIMTFADYYPVCSHYNLLNASRQYCNIANLPEVSCDLCLEKQDGAEFLSQASRRSYISSILENLDAVIFLSHAQQEITQSIYPVLNKKSIIVEGYPVVDKSSSGRKSSDAGVLKVAIPGNFYYEKGGEVLCTVLQGMRNEPVEFHIYGYIPPDYADRLTSLDVHNMKVHGSYSVESLHDKLLDADVSLLLSIWPETYVLTLSESWRAGLVPIVTDIGALGERVENRVNGLKVPAGEAGPVVQLLRELISDRPELDRLRNNIHRGLYLTLDDHLKKIDGIYSQLIQEYRIRDRGADYFKECPDARHGSAFNVYRKEVTWLKVHTPIIPLTTEVNPSTSPAKQGWLDALKKAKHLIRK